MIGGERYAIPIVAAALLAASGCRSGPPGPAPLDTRSEHCASCRMTVSDARFASQLVAAGELPLFFDDLGCLADFLKAAKAPPGAVAYVADHRTQAWVPAGRALYTQAPSLATPMGSHRIAHADALSRDADPAANGGSSVLASEILGPFASPTLRP